jgi:hypothetical protein
LAKSIKNGCGLNKNRLSKRVWETSCVVRSVHRVANKEGVNAVKPTDTLGKGREGKPKEKGPSRATRLRVEKPAPLERQAALCLSKIGRSYRGPARDKQ